VTAPARPAWVYARDMIAEAMQAKVLTKDEACRITTGSSSVIIASWACCAQTKFAVITSKAISVENKRGRGRRDYSKCARAHLRVMGSASLSFLPPSMELYG
jgi:hypothetical protein